MRKSKTSPAPDAAPAGPSNGAPPPTSAAVPGGGGGVLLAASEDRKVEVRCAFSRLVPLGEIKPHPFNPRKHPTQQLEVFERVLLHQGIRRPALVSKRSGFLVAGHGLVETLERLGIAAAPVEEQDFASEADELAHLVADNELAKLGVTVDSGVEAILNVLDEQRIGPEIAGILKAIEENEPTEESKAPACLYPLQPEFDEGYDAVLIFCKTGQDLAALTTILKLGKTLSRRGHVGSTHVITAKAFFELWKSR